MERQLRDIITLDHPIHFRQLKKADYQELISIQIMTTDQQSIMQTSWDTITYLSIKITKLISA